MDENEDYGCIMRKKQNKSSFSQPELPEAPE